MPLFIPLIIVVIALMFYRFKTSRLTRDCRWRQDRARGLYVCAFCGAEIACENDKAPNICLRDKQ
ncbi:MAG: hypothetical protein COB40_13215 [Marinosulfonomonas sp.]|nr:MAG: hypothetical protein COB40_13215 [Marinosulfonomonas sp.]